MDQLKKMQKLAQISQVFTPSAPMDRQELFSGRIDQIKTLCGVLGQKGQHAALYGERGVGKSSLAGIIGDIFSDVARTKIRAVKHNCSTQDDFTSVWKALFRKLGSPIDAHPITPDVLLQALESREDHPLLIIDELDRFSNNDDLSLLSDTIKDFSDEPVQATVILVGVADSIDALIGDHQSIERNLIQVKMPRMSRKELKTITERGLQQLGMAVDDEAKERIARLSEGLPSYAHRLSLHGATSAVMDDRAQVTVGDIEYGVKESVRTIEHRILTDYTKATESPRKDNLFAEVLLACALSEKNDLGYFRPSSVAFPMSKILGRAVDISAFVRHLNAFCSTERREVLQRDGQPRKYRYRFSNPLMQPFVILRALTENLISEGLVDELRPKEGWLDL